MLSYDNMIFNATSLSNDIIGSLPADAPIQPEDMRIVSYLPLSHIAGLIFDLINHMLYGCNIYFAKPDALQGTLVETLQWARPTTFFSVPRVWEKFEEKLKQAASEKPEILQSISGWAKSHGF
jgi:long-chain-fatty-acid--CoA ligase ACSBG